MLIRSDLIIFFVVVATDGTRCTRVDGRLLFHLETLLVLPLFLDLPARLVVPTIVHELALAHHDRPCRLGHNACGVGKGLSGDDEMVRRNSDTPDDSVHFLDADVCLTRKNWLCLFLGL